MKYGFCLNHPKIYAVNAKKLCQVCTKERHERSAESKGLTIKKKDNERIETRNIREWENGSFATHKEYKKTKINNISNVKAKENAELARLKKAKILELGEKCEMCPKQGEVDLFHIIGVGEKKFSTNPVNLLLSCRFCHLIWGANDFDKIQRFINYQDILKRLKSLDEGKYWKFIHRVEKFNNDKTNNHPH